MNNCGACEQRTRRGWATILLVAIVFIATAPAAGAQGDELVLGVFPRQGAQMAHEQYGPIARYLSSVLQRVIRLETAKDFDAFWDNVEKQRYDLIHYNQYHYVKSHATVGYEVILRNEEFGKPTMVPALIVRKDSGISSVADLKGKHVVFGGGRTAMVAYIGAKALLAEHGVHDGDYKEQVAVNPLNAVIAVALGQADAAGTGDIALNVSGIAKRVDVTELTVLATGVELPHLPWAARKGLDHTVVEKVQAALVGLDATPDGRKILDDAGVTRFIPARDADYQSCRELIQRVLNESY